MHISGSKSVCVVICKNTTCPNWIHSIAGKPSFRVCGGDRLTFVSTTLVIKNYRINSAGLQCTDFITSASQILPSNVPHIQADISLKPQKIISTEILPLIHQKMRDAISKSYAAFLVYCFKFIVNILSTLSTYLFDDDKIILQKLEWWTRTLLKLVLTRNVERFITSLWNGNVFVVLL